MEDYDMDELDGALDAYIMAVKSTETYQTYAKERDRVKQYPELKAQIDHFRKSAYELQSRADIDLHKIDQFERDYESFLENPLVEDFLAAELAFCRMMQNTIMKIAEAMEFE